MPSRSALTYRIGSVLMALASRFCFSYRLDHKGIIFGGEIASLRCSCSCCLRRLPINPSIIRYMHLSSSAVNRAIMTLSAAVYRILFLFRCEDTARFACVVKCFAVDSCGALRRITSALRFAVVHEYQRINIMHLIICLPF